MFVRCWQAEGETMMLFDCYGGRSCNFSVLIVLINVAGQEQNVRNRRTLTPAAGFAQISPHLFASLWDLVGLPIYIRSAHLFGRY
jgi:hypothetical protein